MSDPATPVAALARAAGMDRAAVALVAGERTQILTHGVGVNDQTWFQAASSGKHVTACAILDLAARGAFGLDDPIGLHVADLPTAWRDRSIASLLHHTSGLPDYLAPGDTAIPIDRADFLARGDIAPLAPEGAMWSYCNTNYILLGLLAAAATGDAAGRVIQALPARLGITGMQVASPDWVRAVNAGAAEAADGDCDSLRRIVIGDGDIAFNATGAAAWLRMLLGKPVINAAVEAALFAPAALADRSAPYGCGLFLEQSDGTALAHHAGHFDGFTAMLFLNRTLGCGVLALCDLAPGNTRAIRAVALAALEAFAPGSTPLALAPLADKRPDLTATAHRLLVRAGAAPDATALARPLRLALERAGPGRSVIDVSVGGAPSSFTLVEDVPAAAGGTTRRYRLGRPHHDEHVTVRTDAQDRIDWAWPL